MLEIFPLQYDRRVLEEHTFGENFIDYFYLGGCNDLILSSLSLHNTQLSILRVFLSIFFICMKIHHK